MSVIRYIYPTEKGLLVQEWPFGWVGEKGQFGVGASAGGWEGFVK